MRQTWVAATVLGLAMAAAVGRGLAAGQASGAAASPSAPVVRIFSPGDGERFSGGQKKIIYDVRSPPGIAVDRVDVLVDGQPVGTPRGMEREDEVPAIPGAIAGRVIVPLPGKDVTVSLIAHAGDLVSAPATIKLVWGGPGVGPKLFAVVIGVSRYADESLVLQYAAKDATDFAAALQSQSGGLYSDVQTKVLTDAEATRHNIINDLQWLGREVTSNDLGIVYIAGHGWTDRVGNFWFLPVNATANDLDLAVTKDDLLRPLDDLAGKAVLFIDACHAASYGKRGELRANVRGSADMDTLIRDFGAAGHGIVTFASSTGREVSLERADWGNGAFTKALIEGLGDGKAAARDTGQITLSALNYYVANRVKELTGGVQHPIMNQNNVPDFPLAIARLRPELAPEPAKPVAAAPADGAPPAAASPGLTEAQAAFESAARIGTAAAYRSIIESFPNTVQAKLAAAAIAALSEAKPKPVATTRPAERPIGVETPPSGSDAPPAIGPVAALPPAAPVEETKSSADLIKSIQRELARVGCMSGAAEGVWGKAGRKGAERFARYVKISLASLDPSQDFLAILKAQTGRVCPLVCTARYEAKGDNCVLKTCPSGMTLSSAGTCRPPTTDPKQAAPSSPSGGKKTATALGSGCKKETEFQCRDRMNHPKNGGWGGALDFVPAHCAVPANRICR